MEEGRERGGTFLRNACSALKWVQHSVAMWRRILIPVFHFHG